jgi:hypothetical protein
MEFKDISGTIQEVASGYQYKDPPDFLLKLQELITYLWRIVSDFLKHLRITIPGYGDSSGIAATLKVVLVFVGVLCFFGILAMAWSRMNQLKAAEKLAKRGAESTDVNLDSGGWKEKASELAGQGHYREAVRALYLSLIYLMDERGIIDFAPTRTNYEYYYALSSSHPLQRGFRRMADLVEEIWFGNHQAQQDDFETCSQLLSSLESEVAAIAPALAPERVSPGKGGRAR